MKNPHNTRAAARVLASSSTDAPSLNRREFEALTGVCQALGLKTAIDGLDEVPRVATKVVDEWVRHPERIQNLQTVFKMGMVRNLRILHQEDGLGGQIACALFDQIEQRLQKKPALASFDEFVGQIKPVVPDKPRPIDQVLA